MCHGTAALVKATKADGKSIFADHVATGFSNAEEIAIDKVDVIPFLLEDSIKKLGGTYESAPNWEVRRGSGCTVKIAADDFCEDSRRWSCLGS